MRTPEQVRDLLAKRYRRYLTTWLAQDDPEQWPVSTPLLPVEQPEVHANLLQAVVGVGEVGGGEVGFFRK